MQAALQWCTFFCLQRRIKQSYPHSNKILFILEITWLKFWLNVKVIVLVTVNLTLLQYNIYDVSRSSPEFFAGSSFHRVTASPIGIFFLYIRNFYPTIYSPSVFGQNCRVITREKNRFARANNIIILWHTEMSSSNNKSFRNC